MDYCLFLKCPYILEGQFGDRLHKLSDRGVSEVGFCRLKWRLLFTVGYFVMDSQKGPAVERRLADLNKRSDRVRKPWEKAA